MAQGCSDAGVCTIHSIKMLSKTDEESTGRKAMNPFSAGTGFAKGERNTNIYTLQFEYSRQLAREYTITGKLNYNFIKGELGQTSGPGDFFLTLEKKITTHTKWTKSVFGGIKIPISNANKTKNGAGLPMVYQPGLGTTDLLLGFGLTDEKLAITLAWQQPLSGANKNSFLSSRFTSHMAAVYYPGSNQFIRKSDIVIRLSRNFRPGNRFLLQPGLLAIGHTGADSYEDETGNRKKINGSKGITLNAIALLQYNTGKKGSIGISGGLPLAVRAERPDGLTRKFVLSLDYALRFL